MYIKLLNRFKNERSIEIFGLISLVIFSFILRFSAINPIALWYDDLWVGLISKIHSFNDFLLVKAVSPPLFSLLQFVAIRIISDKEVAAQIFPLLFGLIQIPLFYFLVKKITGSKLTAFLGAMILAVSAHELLLYSTRAKHYSFDSLATILLLFFYIKFFSRKINLKYLLLFLMFALVLFLGSFTSIIISGILAHILFFRVVSYFWKSDKSRMILNRIKKLSSILCFDVLTILIYFKLIRVNVDVDIYEYWHNYFINIHQPFWAILMDITGKFGFFTMLPFGSAWNFFAGGIGENIFLILILWLLFFGMVYLYKNKLFEFLFFTAAFYLTAIVLASFKLYPMSGGRVDIYSYPITILLVVCGIWQIIGFLKFNNFFKAWFFVYLYLIFFIFSLPYFVEIQYPYKSDIKNYVDIIEKNITEKDAVLLTPYSDYAFAYYTKWPITFQKYPTATGFIPVIGAHNTFTLPPVGVFSVNTKSIKNRMGYFLSTAGNFEKIYFFNSHCFPEDKKYKDYVYREYIEKEILKNNFSLFVSNEGSSCFLKIYQKNPIIK